MGRFLLGSTVIMTFPKDDLAFNPAWAPAKGVRLGEEMANYPRGLAAPWSRRAAGHRGDAHRDSRQGLTPCRITARTTAGTTPASPA